jgi:hypothetical protein
MGTCLEVTQMAILVAGGRAASADIDRLLRISNPNTAFDMSPMVVFATYQPAAASTLVSVTCVHISFVARQASFIWKTSATNLLFGLFPSVRVVALEDL